MSMMNEFKDFAMKGSVVDMAVGIVIGAAFGKIVSAFVGGVLMPPIGVLLGGVDFSSLAYVIKEETTPIKHSNRVPAFITNKLPALIKLAGTYTVNLPDGIGQGVTLKVYNSQGRMLGAVSLKGRTSINVKRELGVSEELLIIRFDKDK